MPITKRIDKLRSFEFHGICFTRTTDDQSIADCPFCGREQHFYVETATGLWKCLRCGKSGNIVTFLREYHTLRLNETNVAHYRKLASQRANLPPAAFQQQRLAFDASQDCWLIPVSNPEGRIIHLRTWTPGSPVLAAAGQPLSLLGLPSLAVASTATVYLCEGDWDWLALSWLAVKTRQPAAVIGVPGASVFKEEWTDFFRNRKVVVLYDHDAAGKSGAQHVLEALRPAANSVTVLSWPEESPEGYDLRDFICGRLASPKACWKELCSLIDASTVQQVIADTTHRRKEKIPTFLATVRRFRKHLYLDRNMEDGLAIAFAVAMSCKAPGDPLWTFLVAPPGGGKTAVLRAFESVPYCHFRSNLTSTTLVSGFRVPGDKSDEDDPSLLYQLKNQCLVLKDYTEVMSMPYTAQEALYGTLRGAFDGNTDRTYGNKVRRAYRDTYFSIVAGVTDRIYGDDRAALGERFIKFSLLRKYDPQRHVRAALRGADHVLETEHDLREACADFLDREIDVSHLPVTSRRTLDRIAALAQIISLLRTTVARDNRGDPLYEPRAEIATRLARQLLKLGQFLCVVYDCRAIGPKVFTLIEQVGWDTAIGWNVRIIWEIMRTGSASAAHLQSACKIARSSVHRRLADLAALGVVSVQEDEPPRSGTDRTSAKPRGRPELIYTPTPTFTALWKEAALVLPPKASRRKRSRRPR